MYATKLAKAIISLPYQCVHELRKSFYACALFQPLKLPVPVISVGNLSFGGTGKTPVVIYLAEFFASHGYKVLVLNRAYKSSKKNFSNIVLNTRSANADIKVEDIGDEPMEMLLRFMYDGFDITLGLGPNRFNNAMEAIKNHQCNLCILDDGQQHLGLHRDIKLLLRNVNEAGFYREFDTGNYDFELFTKADAAWIAQHKDKNALAFNLNLSKKLDYEREIGVFTGIADPETFLTMVKRHLEEDCSMTNLKFRKFFFPDHHSFSVDEVTRVISLGINIITTPKDIVKIPENLRSNFSVAVPRLEFQPSTFPHQLMQKLNKLF